MVSYKCTELFYHEIPLNLLDILTVDNIYHLIVLKFPHLWHNDILPKVFDDNFYMLEICIDTTQYIQPNRIFISIKLELMQENNHFLSWQLIFGKTFHHKKKRLVRSVGRSLEYHARGLGFEPQTGPTLRVLK